MNHLLALAMLAADDESAIPVLGDAVIEAGWRDRRVMPLVLGMDLDPIRPYFRNAADRKAWERKRERDRLGAQNAWEFSCGRTKPWARAVLAVLLFGDWASKRRRVRGCFSMSPWALIRKMCTLELATYSSAEIFVGGQRLEQFAEVSWRGPRVQHTGPGGTVTFHEASVETVVPAAEFELNLSPVRTIAQQYSEFGAPPRRRRP